MKYCENCAREYPDESLFCPRCGQPLADAPAGPEGAAAALEETVALMVEAAPFSVAVESPPITEAPAAEAPVAEAASVPAKKKRRARVEPPVGFFRHAGAFLLTILLFVFLLVPTLIYEARDTTTERWAGEFMEKVELSDHIDTRWLESGIENWLNDLLPAARGFVRADLSGVSEAVDEFIDRSTLKSFAAAQAGTLFSDIYAGTSTELLTAADFDAFLAENSGLFNELMNGLLGDHLRAALYIDFRLSDADRAAFADVLAGMLDYEGLRPYLSADGVRREMPEAYYGMRFGLSWVTFGVSLVLAVLMFLALVKVLKSGRRAVNRLGIVLVIIGLCLALLAFLPKAIPFLWYEWLALFRGEDLIALLASEFFYTHIVVPDLILLGAGALLIVIVALIRAGKRRRLAK